jgi:hypothetical protein
MRAEVERAYQGGGDVVGPAEPEGVLTVDQIIERTTNPKAGQSLSSMILQNKQQAMDRLRAGRDAIQERRTRQQEEDERSKWLALAQGMLAPTRTGGFGESLGTTAGLMQQQSELRAQHEAEFDRQLMDNASAEAAAESETIDQLLTMTGQQSANSAKSIHGSIQTMVKPEDVGKPVAEQELVFGALQLDPEDGQWRMKALTDANGTYFVAADKLEPARAAALIKAAETAELQTGRTNQFINDAYGITQGIGNIRRAIDLFENAETEIETSGITQWKQRVGEFLNVDFGDKTQLAELQNIIAQDYLDKLQALKGNTSDRDVSIMQGISLGLGRDTDANYITLQKMANHYEAMLSRGVRSAYQQDPPDMDAVADLWPVVSGNRWVPGAKPVKELTQEVFDKLKPGEAVFIDGDWGGVIYTKPAE